MSGVATQSLFKSSWGVLRSDTRIIKAQIVGFIVPSLLIAFAIAAFLIFSETETISSNDTTELTASYESPATLLVFAVLYVLLGFIASIVQAFTLVIALAKFRGEQVTSSQAWEKVKANAKGIFLFSLLSTTIGFVLEYIGERVPLGGKIATWLVGAAWAIASMFSIAVIVDREVSNPIDATKKSAGIFKDTFGSNVKVNLGLTLVTILSVFGTVAIGGLLMLLLSTIGDGAMILGAIAIFAAIMAVVLVISTLGAIIKAALYEYANSGQAPEQFSETLFKAAITEKQAKKIFS